MENQENIGHNKKTTSRSSFLKIWIFIISIVLCIALIAALGTISIVKINDKFDDKIKILQKECEAFESEINTLKANYEQTNEALDSLNNAHKDLEERFSVLEKSKNEVQKELDAYQKELNALKNSNEKANEEINFLKEQLQKPSDKIRIYIDQGHNPTTSHNNGAVGNGLYEEELTFNIGCLLAELLREDGRFEVCLSRPNKSVVLGTDNTSSLQARVDGATEFDADYFISLHINSYTQSDPSGLEIYVAKDGGESYVFGASLLNKLAESTELRNRGMKLNPDLYVLKHAAMPAVLVEMGFISNSGDAALLSSHPDLFAKGLYNGILDFFGLSSR